MQDAAPAAFSGRTVPTTLSRHIEVPRQGNREAASFLAQLEDQTRRLWLDLRGIRPAELQWQPKRGANTIGMLLAHLAIVEVYWLLIAGERMTHAGVKRVLGIAVDDDGMPAAADALPPAHLQGKPLGYYRKLIARARKFVARSTQQFGDDDMERFVVRRRRDGKRTRHSIRWIHYHVLEHFAGHYGQILLLRHLYKDRQKPV